MIVPALTYWMLNAGPDKSREYFRTGGGHPIRCKLSAFHPVRATISQKVLPLAA